MEVKISEFPVLSAANTTTYIPVIYNNINYIIPLSAVEYSQYLKLPVVTTTVAINNQSISSIGEIDETHYVTPSSSLSALSWILPSAANSRVGQIKIFLSTQDITTLSVTISGGGTKIGNALLTAIANEAYSYQCVSNTLSGTWLRLS